MSYQNIKDTRFPEEFYFGVLQKSKLDITTSNLEIYDSKPSFVRFYNFFDNDIITIFR